jgi:predicted GNAT family N-acyltransferase
MSIRINKVDSDLELAHVFEIRREVFVDEQDCPPELEWEYEEESIHFLARLDELPVGAARWRKTDKGYKLERFAVAMAYRGKGVGQALVAAVLADLPEDANYVYLHAQLQAMGLYSKFGFEPEGPQFEEAGIQHFKMVLKG